MTEVTYTVAADDLVAANRLHFLKSISLRRWLITFLASAVAVGMIVWGFIGSLETELYLLTLGGMWALIVTICIVGWLMIPRQARRTWQQGQKMFVEQRVTWDAEKIWFKSARGEIGVSWGDYYRWTADDRNLLLYQDIRMFYLVPLRTFPSGASEEIIDHLKVAGVRER